MSPNHYKDPVTRASQSRTGPLAIFDRQSLRYTNGYVVDYSELMLWSDSYELLDSLLLSKWKGTTELINPNLEYSFIHPRNKKTYYGHRHGVYIICLNHRFKIS